MSNPSCLTAPSPFLPKPSTIFLNCLSFMSTHLLQVILLGSILKEFPWCMWLSTIAASKLLAAPIAWKSPVKCKFISSIGTTCAYPPPAAPPLTPNTGPREGSLNATNTFLPNFCKPSATPIVVVVLPSPAGVGLIAVVNINLAFFPPLSFLSRL